MLPFIIRELCVPLVLPPSFISAHSPPSTQADRAEIESSAPHRALRRHSACGTTVQATPRLGAPPRAADRFVVRPCCGRERGGCLQLTRSWVRPHEKIFRCAALVGARDGRARPSAGCQRAPARPQCEKSGLRGCGAPRRPFTARTDRERESESERERVRESAGRVLSSRAIHWQRVQSLAHAS